MALISCDRKQSSSLSLARSLSATIACVCIYVDQPWIIFHFLVFSIPHPGLILWFMLIKTVTAQHGLNLNINQIDKIRSKMTQTQNHKYMASKSSTIWTHTHTNTHTIQTSAREKNN